MSGRQLTIVAVVVGTLVLMASCVILGAVAVIVVAIRHQTSAAPVTTATSEWEQFSADLQREREAANGWSTEETRERVRDYILATPRVRSYNVAGIVLRSMDQDPSPEVVAVLADPANRTRLREIVPGDDPDDQTSRLKLATGLLRQPPPPGLVAALAPFLDEADAELRAAAAGELAEVRTPEAMPLIHRALRDPASEVVDATLAGLRWPKLDGSSLEPDQRDALFEAILAHDGSEDAFPVASILMELDVERATTHYLAQPLVAEVQSQRVNAIISSWASKDVRVPRERLMELVTALAGGPNSWPAGSTKGDVAYLLALHQHPDDLELLRHYAQSAQERARRSGEGDLSAYMVARGLLTHQGFHGALDTLYGGEIETDDPDANPAMSPASRQVAAALGLSYWFDDDGAASVLWALEPGDYADAMAGFHAMGAIEYADVAGQVQALFGRAGPSANATVREQQVAEIEEREGETLAALDEQWAAISTNLDLLAAEYILANPDLFDELRAQPPDTPAPTAS